MQGAAAINPRLVATAAPLALALVALALYLPSLANPLVWDDTIHIPQALRSDLAGALARPAGHYSRPVVIASYLAQSRLGLGSDAGYHFFNAAVHAVNVVLLFALVVRLGPSVAAAAAAALIFAVHPLQSAAVAYVSGRTDLLAALFTLAALHVALPGRRVARPRLALELASAAAVALLVVLAAGAKEVGLAAGPLVAGICYMDGAAAPRRRILVGAAGLVAACVAAWLVAPAALLETFAVGIQTRLRAAGAAFVTYTRLVVMPTDLHLDRLTPAGSAANAVIGAGVAVAMLAAVAVFLARPTRLRFAVAALAVLYLPASALVPAHPATADRWVFTPEHFMYMPLAALAALVTLDVVVGIGELAARAGIRWPHAGRATALGLATMVALVSVRPVLARQAQLADAESVYRATLAHSPSPRACFNLGVELLAQGDTRQAVSVYEGCARLSPNDAEVFVQLGVAYQRSGRTAEAAFAYQKAVTLDPDSALAWSNFASLEAATGAYAAAREKWQRALAVDPTFEPAHDGLETLDRLGLGRESPATGEP